MRQIRPDCSLQLPTVTVEETEEYAIVRDGYGKTVRNWKHRMSTPDWIDFLIKTPADWEAHKYRAAWNSSRVDWEAARRTYAEGRAEGKFMYYVGAISWDATLPLIGPEAMLYALADNPAWVRDMYQAQADLYLAGARGADGGRVRVRWRVGLRRHGLPVRPVLLAAHV
ncbi:MAG: hypothetical protein M5R40_05180 [Anaerolineae bacterium]|nr:hypothetical protein [Anaerolineae bacterium]